MKRTALALLFILLSSCLSTAQETPGSDDSGGWGYVQFNKSFHNGVFSSLRAEYRVAGNWSGLDLWFVRPAIGYKFSDWLSAGVCYDYLQRPEALQHRGLAYVSGTVKSGQLSASLREMYVRTYSFPEGADGLPVGVSNTLRSRLNVKYTDPATGLKSYLCIEMFTWKTWQNTRHYVGTLVPLTENCNLDLCYIYLTRSSGLHEHVLGAGLNIVL